MVAAADSRHSGTHESVIESVIRDLKRERASIPRKSSAVIMVGLVALLECSGESSGGLEQTSLVSTVSVTVAGPSNVRGRPCRIGSSARVMKLMRIFGLQEKAQGR